jgi:DNA-binding FadR family transcriptional regulator
MSVGHRAGNRGQRDASLTPRRTAKISELVARDIVHDMKGLPPGTMLPAESAMLDRYQVGRASLREALRILEVQGLIVILPGPGGGPMVAPIQSRDFARMTSLYLHLSGATYRDVVVGRLVMEPVMARLASEREDVAQLAELEQFIVPATLPVDDVTYLQRSSDFHSVVSGLSGNPVLDFMGRSLKDIYNDRVGHMVFPREARDRVEHDHIVIAKAIVAGQADKAERLMREHMEEFVQYAEERNPGVLDEVVDWR